MSIFTKKDKNIEYVQRMWEEGLDFDEMEKFRIACILNVVTKTLFEKGVLDRDKFNKDFKEEVKRMIGFNKKLSKHWKKMGLEKHLKEFKPDYIS